MNDSAIFNMFDDELEIRSDRLESSDVLVQKNIEDAHKVKFTNAELAPVVDRIERSFDGESTKSFYIHLHDNIIKELVFFDDEPNAAGFVEKAEQNFNENPAKEGGCCLFGMVDLAARTMLTAFLEPYCEVRIASHVLLPD